VIAEPKTPGARPARRDDARRPHGVSGNGPRDAGREPLAIAERFRAARFTEPRLHPSEGGAATAADALPSRTSLAALLTGHILRDGEVVLLILKPSLWFIVFSSMRFAAVVLIVTIAAQLWMPPRVYFSFAYAGAFLLAGRVMWAVLQWMGRLYVLTDMRIVRLSGVFNVEIFDCALRKVATARLTRTFREKLWRLGSIEIVPSDDSCAPSVWQTVRRPNEVHAKVQATIERAKQGGPCSPD
jgi:hypothetical protein